MIANRRRKHQAVEPDSEGTWIISYADMITLLLAFFVMFFTVNPKAQKAEGLQVALIQALNGADQCANRTPAKQKLQELEVKESSIGALARSTSIVVENDLLKKLEAQVHEVNGRILVEFPQVSFFRSAKIGLTPEGKRALRLFTKKYLPFAGSYTLGIQAFTDQKMVVHKKGRRFKDNLELSALRAIAAMRVLEANGIPLQKMKISGYGEMSMTARDLILLRDEQTQKDPLAFARKVVLSIEPEVNR